MNTTLYGLYDLNTGIKRIINTSHIYDIYYIKSGDHAGRYQIKLVSEPNPIIINEPTFQNLLLILGYDSNGRQTLIDYLKPKES